MRGGRSNQAETTVTRTSCVKQCPGCTPSSGAFFWLTPWPSEHSSPVERVLRCPCLELRRHITINGKPRSSEPGLLVCDSQRLRDALRAPYSSVTKVSLGFP
jgi:hypothetical protein